MGDELRDEDRDLLPRPETLARLHAIVAQLGLVKASLLAPLTESERHELAHGHRLAHGCCRRAG